MIFLLFSAEAIYENNTLAKPNEELVYINASFYPLFLIKQQNRKQLTIQTKKHVKKNP